MSEPSQGSAGHRPALAATPRRKDLHRSFRRILSQAACIPLLRPPARSHPDGADAVRQTLPDAPRVPSPEIRSRLFSPRGRAVLRARPVRLQKKPLFSLSPPDLSPLPALFIRPAVRRPSDKGGPAPRRQKRAVHAEVPLSFRRRGESSSSRPRVLSLTNTPPEKNARHWRRISFPLPLPPCLPLQPGRKTPP